SSRRRHTRFSRDWSSDACSSDLRLRHRPMKAINILRILFRLLSTSGSDSTPESSLYCCPLDCPLSCRLSYFHADNSLYYTVCPRSEERRVGKEDGAGWLRERLRG